MAREETRGGSSAGAPTGDLSALASTVFPATTFILIRRRHDLDMVPGGALVIGALVIGALVIGALVIDALVIDALVGHAAVGPRRLPIPASP